MATLIGVKWKHGGQFLPNFKLLNVISAELMDCNTTIDHNTLIPGHKLGQNYVYKLKNLAEIVKFTYYRPCAEYFSQNFDPMDCCCCHHY